MIHLVTFATPDMFISAKLCAESAMKCGVNAASVRAGQPSGERGAGYWRWKPAIILDAMNKVSDSDLIIYSDAGVEFIEPVSIVIDRMDQDIWLFGNETYHRQWCKRDIIDEVWPLPIDKQSFVDAGIAMSSVDRVVGVDVEAVESLYSWNRFDRQAQASVIFFRVNEYTRRFVKEWLDWCLFEGGRLIDDSPSRLPNHPDFIENRHDQAILTTLAYREGIKLHHWYVRYPENTPGRGSLYPGDNYPPLFMHHRRRNHQWEQAA